MKFPAHAWTRACTEAISPVRHPCSRFPALWKRYTLRGTSPERGLSDPCCTLPSASLPPQLSGASPCPASSQTGRAEPSTSSSHPALALTSLLPCPSPSPHGGLTFSWPDDREVGRASSCFGWLCSVKLTRVLVNHVATPWLCSSVMCWLWGWVLYRVRVNCIIETVGVISSSGGLLDSLCIDWTSGDQGIVPGWSHHFPPPASVLPGNCSELPLPVWLALTASTLRRTFCTILKNMFYFP